MAENSLKINGNAHAEDVGVEIDPLPNLQFTRMFLTPPQRIHQSLHSGTKRSALGGQFL